MLRVMSWSYTKKGRHCDGFGLHPSRCPTEGVVSLGNASNQTSITIMKKIILACLVAAALLPLTGCGTDKPTHSSTTTTEQTTVPAPITTTTTDTQTK
jgi:predicted small lipoprotein YifL